VSRARVLLVSLVLTSCALKREDASAVFTAGG
jgi:hypothetical protein